MSICYDLVLYEAYKTLSLAPASDKPEKYLNFLAKILYSHLNPQPCLLKIECLSLALQLGSRYMFKFGCKNEDIKN